jgi:GxxExxY protein
MSSVVPVTTENAIAKEIVDATYRIHASLGPGLLESVYESILEYDLTKRGLDVVSQQLIPVIYEKVQIQAGFRADLIINDKVIIEVKAVEFLAPVHKRQLLTYLRLADKRLGLLLNFNVYMIKEGIVRIANSMPANEPQDQQ